MNVNGGKRTKKKRKRPRGRGRGEEEKVGPKEANFDIDDVDGVLVEEDRRGVLVDVVHFQCDPLRICSSSLPPWGCRSSIDSTGVV